MEKKEVAFGGVTLNGFLMLFVIIALFALSVGTFIIGVEDGSVPLGLGGALLFILGPVL